MTRIFSLLLMAAASLAAAQDRGLTARDLVMMDRVSAPAISPDGDHVAYVVRSTELDDDSARRRVWLVAADGSRKPRPLTSATANASSPRWSRDGRYLYFLSDRSETGQVWRLPMAGGEAQQVTDSPVDVETFQVSPEDDRIAFSARVFSDCKLIRCTFERLAEQKRNGSSAQVYEKLLMRHWDTWDDGRISRIFTAPLNDSGSGGPVLVTGDIDGNTPSRPFGGADDYTFSADGRSLFVAARPADRTEAWSTNFDIFQVPADGSGRTRNLTQDNEAWDTHPVVSADGRYLAYAAMARPGFEADRFQIILRDLRSGETRSLTPDWDRSAGAHRFTQDGRALVVAAQDTGRRLLWRLNVATGKPEPLTELGYVGDFDVVGETVVYAHDELSRPADLFLRDTQAKSAKRLTRHNARRLAEIRMGEYEQFHFSGWNDERVYGYVMRPWNARRGRRYPVAFLIHGGPQGSFGDHFHYRWNPQTYAAEGFATVFIDFHGSTGYGQAFTDSISNDWGGKPLEDLRKGLAAALERYSFLDGDRVCALGASYGGYMINWIAGQWPERFRCLVNHDGVFDNRSMYYTTEELWFPEWEHSGPQFSNPEAYEKYNPVNHVDRWQTPMLVIHGELDYRVPVTQSLAAFTALQRRSVPSRLLYFPDENHWVLKPNNSLRWHGEVMSWLHRWLDD